MIRCGSANSFPMSKIRVIIVDDAVSMRRMMSAALAADPCIEVVGTAPNGRIALQKIGQLNPDVVTMDMEMPEMDGVTAVRELRKTHSRLPVIMVSSMTRKGAEATLDALAAGATDYVTKPAGSDSLAATLAHFETELLPKLKMHYRSFATAAARTRPLAPPTAPSPPLQVHTNGKFTPQVLAIGCSTGGPNALAELFRAFTSPLPVPCVIVQHMPPLFTKMFAERLDKLSPNRVYEGTDGQVIEPGSIYIAPGGLHMEVRREAGGPAYIHLQKDPPENSCRPAVDVLFRSITKVFGADVLAMILTGMGQDGLIGCQSIREQGGRVLVQDEASSVVWGMPGSVATAGLAHMILPLPALGAEVMHTLIPATRSMLKAM